MPNLSNILFICGDLRSRYMVEELLHEGNYNIYSYGLFNQQTSYSLSDLTNICNLIILPIPFTKDQKNINSITDISVSIREVCDLIKPGVHEVIGGALPLYFKKYCDALHIRCVDLLDYDDVALKNGIATAEGAICEAIKTSSSNIHGSESLVLGYGKCGKILTQKLLAMNSTVTVAARNKDQLAAVYTAGAKTIDLNLLGNDLSSDIISKLESIDIIFNTIPTLVLTSSILSRFKKDVLILDIAKAPGGCDYNYCKSENITALLLPGLPGKYSPKSSSKILVDKLLECI